MTVTLAIIIVTCLVSFPAFNNDKIKEDLLFWPYEIQRKNQYYRFLTAGFLHADTMHLIFNMVSLYSFGAALEYPLYPSLFDGKIPVVLFSILYLSSIVVACIPDYFKYKNEYSYRALGASGAVSAVIFSAIIIQPTSTIRFFFIPFDIPGWAFGLLFLALSAYLAKKGGGNIGHSAHFWGGVYGIVFTWLAARAFTNVDLLKRFAEQVF